MSDSDERRHALIEARMRKWIEQLVLGLELCPFARRPFEAGQVRIAVSDAEDPQGLLEDLQRELAWLDAQPPEATETTLIAISRMLDDFLDYNDFLGLAETLLTQLGWEGRFQIASFHPQYRFAGTDPDDAENYTNRAPYPTLHLLREDSLAQVLACYPDAEAIPDRNIETMNRLGRAKLAALLDAPKRGH